MQGLLEQIQETCVTPRERQVPSKEKPPPSPPALHLTTWNRAGTNRVHDQCVLNEKCRRSWNSSHTDGWPSPSSHLRQTTCSHSHTHCLI